MSHRTRGGWRAARIASEPDRFGVAGGLSYAQGRLRTACGGGQARLMVFTRAEAVADGVSDSELKSLLKRGDHVRLVRGVYADAAELAGWEEDQHRTRVMGVARISNLLVSHISAAVLHGLPVPGGDLTEVHATRLGIGGNRQRSTRHVHSGTPPSAWQTTHEGAYVTTVPRTLVDVAKTQPRLAAVTAADAALHRGLCTDEEISDALRSAYRHRGAERRRSPHRYTGPG